MGNRRFADLLGYDSPKASADTEIPLAEVVEKDRNAVVAAYEKASENIDVSSPKVTVKNMKTRKPIKIK
jgi:hypothetical protein